MWPRYGWAARRRSCREAARAGSRHRAGFRVLAGFRGAAGLPVIEPAVRAALLAAATSRPAKQPEQKLPGKLPDGPALQEAEILSMMARGMTNPDITAELYNSAQTIKNHINRIFAKTGSANRIAAIRYARDRHPGWQPASRRIESAVLAPACLTVRITV
jgi:DNA-binding CsgD family transcriptional regulator